LTVVFTHTISSTSLGRKRERERERDMREERRGWQ